MKRLLLTAAFFAASFSVAGAADLLAKGSPAEVPAVAPAPSSINGYIQLMGGWAMPNTLHYVYEEDPQSSNDFDAGLAVGATFGIETPIEGLSLEVDVLRTLAGYDGEGEDGLNSTSIMSNAVYSAELNEMVSLYGGAGVGIIALDYFAEGDDDVSGSGAGYQVFAGVQAAVAENVSLTLEARYQASLDDITMEYPQGDSWEQEFNRTSILAGVLFSF